MPERIPPSVSLRQLLSEVAGLMQAIWTFKEIADKFHEVGIIPKPESPYGTYDGNKRDYAVERLFEASDLDAFLRVVVPEVIVEIDIEGGPSTARAEQLMKRLGYELDPDDPHVQEYGYRSYVPPASFPPLHIESEDTPEASRRIAIPDLPAEVQGLVDELEDSLDRSNRNAAALLTRKIIHLSVFIAMRKRGKEAELRDDAGNDLDLGVALRKCGQECGVSKQVIGRITSAKWIGDSANHSYRVKVNDADLDQAVTGLRLFLQEVL